MGEDPEPTMSISAPRSPRGGRRLLAPLWHTAVLVAVLVVSCAAGFWFQDRASADPALVDRRSGVLPLYLAAMLVDWSLFFFVLRFTSRSGTPLGELVGGSWRSAKSVAIDLAISLPFWLVWSAVARGVHRLLGPGTAKSVDPLLPRTAVEIAVWIAVSLTAGFCEESIFRGYLQKQLQALTGNAPLAVVGQGVLFGMGHGYQGLKSVILIAVLGVLYGVLAAWRRSARPGMFAHAWSDVYAGLRMNFVSRLLPF